MGGVRRALTGALLALTLSGGTAHAAPPVELKAAQRIQTPPMLSIDRARRAMDRWANRDESDGSASGHLLWACHHVSSRTVGCNISQFDYLWDGDRGTLKWQIRATLNGQRIRIWSTLFEL